MRTSILASLLLSMLATGCASLSPILVDSEAADTARVSLVGRERNLFHLDVENTSDRMLVASSATPSR